MQILAPAPLLSAEEERRRLAALARAVRAGSAALREPELYEFVEDDEESVFLD